MPRFSARSLRVALGVIARIARRHRHTMDVIGTEGIDGDAGDDGRVDATRQRDHDVVETVLGAVVACAEHQCVVQLAIRVERLGDRDRCWRLVDDRSVADDHGREQRVGHPASRIEQPLAVHRRHRHVDHEQILDELRCPRQQGALVVEHDRTTVEHQLVLATDLVDVHDRRVRVGRPCRQHPLALGALAGVERRRVDVDADLGTGGSLLGDRPERTPDVLADRDADLDPSR